MTPLASADSNPGLARSRVQVALALMAESEFFVAAPRLHGLLCFLVETTLAEPDRKITQRLIAECYLGKGSDFDPTIDPVVRVAIGRLRVALERYDAAGLNTSVRFEIPKRSYRVLIHELSSPVRVDDALSLLRKPIAVMPVVAARHGSDDASMDELLHAAFVERLSSFGVGLLSIDVLESFLRDPSQSVISASQYFGFDVIISFRPASVSGQHLVNVQVSHVDGSLIWAKQFFETDQTSGNALSAKLIDQVVNDLAGHFGVLRVSSGLLDRLSGSPELNPGLAPLEDYAIYAFRMYELLLSTEWHDRAEKALLEAVDRGSEHPLVLAKLAYLMMDKFVFTSPVNSDLLSQGLGFLAHSRKADPEHPYVLFVDSVASLYQGDYLGMHAKVNRLTALSPSSQFYRDFAVWIDALSGQFVELNCLLERLKSTSVLVPSWFWFAPFLEAYAGHRFDECLQAAISFGCEDLFWSPLMKALAYWGLGESGSAALEMKRALALNPSLVDDDAHYIACFVVSEALRQAVLNDVGAIQDFMFEAG